VASLIKAALACITRQIPPSLGYEAPNPAIDFEHSPFRVNDTLSDWISHKGPRRGGREFPGRGRHQRPCGAGRGPAARGLGEPADWPFQMLLLSARSKAALDGNAANLAAHLRDHPEQDLADVAWTLKEGRHAPSNAAAWWWPKPMTRPRSAARSERSPQRLHPYRAGPPRRWCSCSPAAARNMPAWRATFTRPNRSSPNGWIAGWISAAQARL
jgi:hypothetical protein